MARGAAALFLATGTAQAVFGVERHAGTPPSSVPLIVLSWRSDQDDNRRATVSLPSIHTVCTLKSVDVFDNYRRAAASDVIFTRWAFRKESGITIMLLFGSCACRAIRSMKIINRGLGGLILRSDVRTHSHFWYRHKSGAGVACVPEK